MFKNLFKKKKKEEVVVEKFVFLAHIHTRNMGVHKILGHYADAIDLATRLSNLMDTYDSFTARTVDGDEIVIKSKDVEFIRVESEPYEA